MTESGEVSAPTVGERWCGCHLAICANPIQRTRKTCGGVRRRLVEILVGKIEIESIGGEGGAQTNTVVHYRFAQPGQALPVILPKTYSGSVVRVPAEPKTIGDHVRRRRVTLKLRQKDVAERIGVTTPTVFNWEANSTTPDRRIMPAVAEFLGYDPMAKLYSA